MREDNVGVITEHYSGYEKVGALWLNQSERTGKEYLKGYIDEIKVVGFMNSYPHDYSLCVNTEHGLREKAYLDLGLVNGCKCLQGSFRNVPIIGVYNNKYVEGGKRPFIELYRVNY